MRAFVRKLASALEVLRPRRPGESPGARAAFRLMYERFREILSLNDSVLELIADIEDRLAGRRPFALAAVEQRVRKAAMDVFVMVKNLNQLAGGRHAGLYEALRRLNADLEVRIAAGGGAPGGPLVMPLEALRASDAHLAGNKMANLGEVAAGCGLAVPEGFAVTTAATDGFLDAAGLWGRCGRLEGILELDGPAAAAEACAEVQTAIRDSELPPGLVASIEETFLRALGPDARVAVRSSAVGEDSQTSSHAGLYTTKLDVGADDLSGAYLEVVASAFSPTAVSYRFERGLTARDALMAVGCVRMVDARRAGIAYSRPPQQPSADEVVVSVTVGLADRVAAGEQGAEVAQVLPGRKEQPSCRLLDATELTALAAMARRLEAHFGCPQDTEWAIDRDGRIFVVQTRPLAGVEVAEEAPPVPPDGWEVLLRGGFTASRGAGSGPVVQVTSDDELDAFPEGGVLVARHSSPTFARVMRRAAAVVTEIGAPTGHMASLAREAGVPAIVGVSGAFEVLGRGVIVTVNADARVVLAGPSDCPRPSRPSLGDSPAVRRLAEIARLVTPLHLTDPTAPEFTPASCRSLHDVTRFVHERVYEVMFHYGDLAITDRQASVRLDARLPIVVRLFDVGGGVETTGRGRVPPERVTSVPLAAFLMGMLEPRIRWDLPRPVSVRGFLSVLGESMSGPPPEVQQVGRMSYAIVSDRYMNFSTKAGYHFSTVDAFCGPSQNKNYVHFRFNGGGADAARRARRVRFLSLVLAALEFRVAARGDLLTARLDKYDEAAVRSCLVDLGHLTMCARQLDMLMDTDSSPEFFARAFLAREWEKF